MTKLELLTNEVLDDAEVLLVNQLNTEATVVVKALCKQIDKLETRVHHLESLVFPKTDE